VRPIPALLLLAGCGLENNLGSGKGEDETPFDSGGEFTPPIDTSVEDTDLPDTGDTVDPAPDCPSQNFPGYVLSSRDDCEAEPVNPAWSLSEMWSTTGSGYILSAPAIGQLTDDNGNGKIDDGDTPDIVLAPYTSSIAAYSGDDGTQHWSAGSSQIEQTTPAIGDLDGDGWPEVVVGGLYGSLAVHGEDGSSYWSGVGPSGIKAYCGAVALGDMDGDGDPEVAFGKEIVNGQTGARLGVGAYGQGSTISGEAPASFMADIDQDGVQEVLAGNAAYDMDGDAVWTTGASDGYAAVGNFDSDDEAEVAVTGSGGTITLWDDDGSKLWTATIGGSYAGPPTIADFDGDGEPEVSAATGSYIAVIDTDGSVLWTRSVSASWFDGTSAYDLDGDGVWELLHNASDGLYIYAGDTGKTKASYTHPASYNCGQLPVVADLDNDDHVDIAFTVYASSGVGLYVVTDDDGFTPGRGVWNQHSYSITNVEDDMSIPTTVTANWLDGYNNFRAGPPIEKVAPSQNVTPIVLDVCNETCKFGDITVWYALGNDGSEVVTDDIPVAIYGVTDTGAEVLLYETTWTDDLDPEWMSSSAEVEISGITTAIYDIVIRIDGGNSSTSSSMTECDETDNEYDWGAYVCSEP
jgi:hypothetical protein